MSVPARARAAFLHAEFGRLLAFLAITAALSALWFRDVWTDGVMGLFDWRKDEFFVAYLVASLREQGLVPSAFFAVPINLNYPTINTTRLYFANPEVIAYSPWLFLAHWFSGERFVLALLAAHLLLAALGLWQLGALCRFPFVFRVLSFVLLALNPWLMQHLAIGYLPWINALLVPLALWGLLHGRGRPLVLVIGALLSALIIYQGGLHVWLWMNFAVATVALALALIARRVAPLARVALFGLLSTLAAAPRLLATTREFHGLVREPLGSYASWSDVLGLLLDARTNPYDLPRAYDVYGTNLYDASVVVGLPWLVVLAICLLLFLRRARQGAAGWPTGAALLVAAAWFVVCGWDGVWRALVALLPLLSTDVYPWRFLFLAVVLLTVFMLHELVFLYRRGAAVGQLGALVLCLALVPSNYQRNQAFCAVAAQGEAALEQFNLRRFLGVMLPVKDLADGRSLPPTLLHDHLVYPPTPAGYHLPWLSRALLRSFEIRGAELEFRAGEAGARSLPSERALVIAARASLSPLEATLPLLAFGGIAIGLSVFHRRRSA
ncbi:MAG: hypothetical protein K2Y51_19830 [Gammaproteobacteria bacterium]|nr:hypothetical protein [Gammaproteobacteria bacterium]